MNYIMKKNYLNVNDYNNKNNNLKKKKILPKIYS